MKEGMSLRTTASVLGVSKSTVQRIVSSHDEVLPDGRRVVTVGRVMGVDGKVRPSRRIDTTDRDAEIWKRRADGESLRQIAEAVECSVGTVHRVLKNAP